MVRTHMHTHVQVSVCRVCRPVPMHSGYAPRAQVLTQVVIRDHFRTPHGACSMPRCFFFKFYLFIFRELGREGEKEGEKQPCAIDCPSHTPKWGPGPQPRHVP